MKIFALDTNVLIDYFLSRPGYKQAYALFQNATQGKIACMIFLPVMLEFEWTMRRYYKVPKNVVVNRLQAIINLPGCEVENKSLVGNALLTYSKNTGVSFDDCLIALMAKQAKIDEFITSDRKLKKLYARL